MADAQKIVDLNAYRRTTAQGLEATSTLAVEVTRETSNTKLTDLTDLYEKSDQENDFVSVVTSRVARLKQQLHEAKLGDNIDKDDAVSLLKAELPNLFALDDWSDGSSAVILALHHSLRNSKGIALSADQYFAVERAVGRLLQAPFLSFDNGLDVVDELKVAGFDTDPEEASILYGLLNE